MRAGLTISTVAHAGLLLWGLVSFSARPLEAKPTPDAAGRHHQRQAVLGNFRGREECAQVGYPKPLVDKQGRQQARRRNDVQDLRQAGGQDRWLRRRRPRPQPEKLESKPDKKPPPKVDAIAEALKKEEAKKKRDEANAKAAELKKQKEQQQPKFDPMQIAALLDKRDAQRKTATGETVSQTPNLGYANATAARLSQSEIDALRRRLSECWSPPVGAANAPNLKVVFRVLFNRDGTVAAQPAMVAGTASPFGPAMAESAKRAILTCQPFKMLRADTYDQWKDIEITFDPRDMFGG